MVRETKPNANQVAFLAELCVRVFMVVKTRVCLTRHLSRGTVTSTTTMLRWAVRCRPLSTLLNPHRSYIRPFRANSSMTRVLDFHDGPLVWVDCEMTGLDPRKDKILEIAV
jgi:Exonuclease